jgi:hypothetical protein
MLSTHVICQSLYTSFRYLRHQQAIASDLGVLTAPASAAGYLGACPHVDTYDDRLGQVQRC